MNYFEELGLAPEATAEEIRLAYRNLARLLHPDQQPDEALRRLAESQMKRLNAVHDVLGDPVRRRQYAACLRSPGIPQVRRARLPGGRELGFLAAGAALATLCWLLFPPAQSEPAAPATARADSTLTAPVRKKVFNANTGRPANPSAELQQPDLQPAVVLPERDAALIEPARPATAVDPPPVRVFRGTKAPALSPPQTAAQFDPLLAPATQTAQPSPGFRGTWVYVQPRLPPSPAPVYPAEYVEAVILDEGGVVRGQYRARYLIPDRAISSEVIFRFEGRSNGGTASLSWTGAGGAKGDLSLKLVSSNSMELTWIATDLGSQMGLSSGTAVLTRRQEP